MRIRYWTLISSFENISIIRQIDEKMGVCFGLDGF